MHLLVVKLGAPENNVWQYRGLKQYLARTSRAGMALKTVVLKEGSHMNLSAASNQCILTLGLAPDTTRGMKALAGILEGPWGRVTTLTLSRGVACPVIVAG